MALSRGPPLAPLVWVALTGTPGVGKSTLAAELARRGHACVEAAALARDAGLLVEEDPRRPGTFLVDEAAAGGGRPPRARPEGVAFVEGHLAHELPVDLVVLLRLDPRALALRLAARGWPEAKVRENAEAEALDVVAGEVVASGASAAEIDATGKSVEVLAEETLAIVESHRRGLKSGVVGSVAWPLESLPWF